MFFRWNVVEFFEWEIKEVMSLNIVDSRTTLPLFTNIKNKYNIDILYLWETDVNENLELCRKLISLYVHNNGILENYHSFNYILNENNELELLKEKYVIGY